MSLDYFYAPPSAVSGGELRIGGGEFNHLSHVMRKQVGDRLMVVDGCGHAYEVEIVELSRHAARCVIRTPHGRVHEPSIHLSIAAALLKNPSRFDYLVEKSTEIGVSQIDPLLTERTIPGHGKQERWKKIALGAMKQSQRSVLPYVSSPGRFPDFVRSAPAGRLLLIAHESVTGPSLRDVLKDHQSITIAIGPEGGFTDEEIADAMSAGFTPVTLGERRFRSETAALVAAAVILA
jgi:16S rRNA (uracil1498-N3)-methyltransferase